MLDNCAYSILKVYFLIPALFYTGLAKMTSDPDRELEYEMEATQYWMGFDQPEKMMTDEQFESHMVIIKIVIFMSLNILLMKIFLTVVGKG